MRTLNQGRLLVGAKGFRSGLKTVRKCDKAVISDDRGQAVVAAGSKHVRENMSVEEQEK
jgi:hypothetical protein